MIKVKSVSDVITNSSSEVFVIKDKISLEEAKEILKEISTGGYREPEVLDKDSDIVKELINFGGFFVDPNDLRQVEDYYLTLILEENYYDDDYNIHPNKYYHFDEFKKYIDERLEYLADYFDKENKGFEKYNPFSNPNMCEVSGYIDDYPSGFISEFIKSSGIDLPKIPEYKLIESIYGCIGVRSKGDNTIDNNTFENIVEKFDVEHYHLG